ncbi:hypothetical protein Y032_0117g697 [Ancylostoma ceylanicum]|uniref:Transposase Tc1-like domain-containing protein n=1 Tax=Ancylostoma ceylanicum TaxID=53326 RepID=A0A016TBA7_9BILA|nr:hypothetical protein Y032_0117g697 [Ancylostoma ceylanicum]
MVRAHPKRGAILDSHSRGHGTRKNSKLLETPQRTVQETSKRFKELGTISDRPGRGRKATAVVPTMINKVLCRIWRNRRRSMRKMAKEAGISSSPMRRVVRKKLRLDSYRAGRAPLLTEEMKQMRLKKCKKLRRRFAGGSHHNILLSLRRFLRYNLLVLNFTFMMC